MLFDSIITPHDHESQFNPTGGSLCQQFSSETKLWDRGETSLEFSMHLVNLGLRAKRGVFKSEGYLRNLRPRRKRRRKREMVVVQTSAALQSAAKAIFWLYVMKTNR